MGKIELSCCVCKGKPDYFVNVELTNPEPTWDAAVTPIGGPFMCPKCVRTKG